MKTVGTKERKTDDQPRRGLLPRRASYEEAEEQQGGPRSLEDQDRDADQPHHHDGAEVVRARQPYPQELAPADGGQVVAVGHQVAGEEDREGDLTSAARLHGERPQVIHTRAPNVSCPRLGIMGQQQE